MLNRDEIINLMHETECLDEGHYGSLWMERFERFAALVASAERERIAQMIEEAPPLMAGVQNNEGGCLICGFTPKLAAAAIRARGNL